MPFPWRDFILFVLAIGLAIGLAAELKAVREVSGLPFQAQQAERLARAVGANIAQRTGNPLQITELDRIVFTSSDGKYITDWVNIRPRPFRRPERSPSLFTGMFDLDVMLSMVVVIPVSTGLGLWFRKSNPNSGKAFAKYSIQNFRWTSPLFICWMTGLAISSYTKRQPFFGALEMAIAAPCLVQFLTHFHIQLTPELEKQIDDNYEKPIDPADWQFLTRWSLRDFFWIMLLIALTITIATEHHRATQLESFREQALWWEAAVDALQQRELQPFRNPKLG